MKKLLLLVPVIFILFSFYFKEEEKTVTEITSALKKSQNTKSNISLSARKKSDNPSTLMVDSDCNVLKNKLDEIDFNLDIQEWLERIDVNSLTCKDTSLNQRMKNVRKDCFGKEVKEDCSFQLLVLRSILRTKGLSEGANQEELADLIIKEFSNKELNFKNLEKFAKELMQFDPSNLSVQRLWAISKTLSQPDFKNLSPDVVQEIYENLDEDSWNDPQLKGLELILNSGLRPQEVENFAKKSILKDPTDPYTYEMLGWSLWQQNRRTDAIKFLEKAISLSP